MTTLPTDASTAPGRSPGDSSADGTPATMVPEGPGAPHSASHPASHPDRPEASAFPLPETANHLGQALKRAGYIADSKTALVAWLALKLGRPLLLEGPAGVGKTDLARALAEGLGRSLLRLQCYEGLDEGKALYEWDYAKQILYTQLLRDAVATQVAGASSLAEAAERVATADVAFFNPRFLIARPLLKALESESPTVLLLDEVDRADQEFEAFLLEVLAENQATIPEIGTIKAKHPPLVVLTTNGTREMTDALRRRCLHLFLDYPPPSRELEIIEIKLPGIARELAEAITTFVEKVRRLELRKAPSISEAIDWARGLILLNANALDKALVQETLGLLVKYDEDRETVEGRASSLLKK